MTTTYSIRQMSLTVIAEQCAQQAHQFRTHGESDSAYCFELFRRAIVQKNEAAWHCVYDQYRKEVFRWVHSHSEFSRMDEECEYFVNQAFANFVNAFRVKDKFARFESLAAILAYLKACTHSAVRDEARKRSVPIVEMPEYVYDRSGFDLEQTILEDEKNRILVELIASRVKNVKEQVIIEAYFGQGLKPDEIYQRHAALFGAKQEVYRVKQNLLERLRRDAKLWEVWEKEFPC